MLRRGLPPLRLRCHWHLPCLLLTVLGADASRARDPTRSVPTLSVGRCGVVCCCRVGWLLGGLCPGAAETARQRASVHGPGEMLQIIALAAHVARRTSWQPRLPGRRVSITFVCRPSARSPVSAVWCRWLCQDWLFQSVQLCGSGGLWA